MSPDTGSPVARHPDAEELAAFVDGRLTGAARDRMVAHLADCAECHAMMVDVATVLRDPALADGAGEPGAAGDDGDASPTAAGKVLRPPAGRFRRALPRIGAVAAAALIALVVWMVVGRWILAPAPATVAALLAPLAGDGAPPVSAAEIEGRGWPAVRGAGGTVTTAGARSFQLGMLNADLQIARAAGDADTASTVTAWISRRLEESGGEASYVAALYAMETGADVPDPVAEADRLLAARLAGDPPWYALGRWAGVARGAVDADDAEWFSRPAPRRTLRHLLRHDWPSPAGRPLERVGALAAGGVDRDELPEVETALSELITAAGGGTLGTDPE